MKIGIDLDDVVWEHFGPVLDYINEKNGTDFKLDNLKTFKIWESFDISREEAFDSVKSFHDSGKMDEVSFIDGAREIIKDLTKGNELVFVTSRAPYFKEQTLNLLKKNGFEIPIFFSRHLNEENGKTKFEICRDEKIDVMIEDSSNHAVECAEGGIKVILFDKPWNQGVEYKNIIRIKSWMEVRSILK
jgi:uncharacterized HAD superfamily protein